MEYRYRSTFRGTKKVPPDIVAAELERLRQAGELTSARVVETAAANSSPLHAAFEWDNRKAGAEYRLIQARVLIRAIVVVQAEEAVPEPPRSLYVHVESGPGNEGKYVRLADVADQPDEYEIALGEAARRLEAAEDAVRELRRLAEGRGSGIEALAIATQGLSAVREAIAMLRMG